MNITVLISFPKFELVGENNCGIRVMAIVIAKASAKSMRNATDRFLKEDSGRELALPCTSATSAQLSTSCITLTAHSPALLSLY